MNLDDFEKELKRQPLRKVPPEWKGKILDESLSLSERERERTSSAWLSRIQELLWPSPMAWSALAAIWIVIAGLRIASMDAEKPKPVAADYTQLRLAMELKREIVAEPQTASQTRRPDADKPRSQIRPKASAA